MILVDITRLASGSWKQMKRFHAIKVLAILLSVGSFSAAVAQPTSFTDPTLVWEGDWITNGPGKRIIDVVNAPGANFQQRLQLSLDKAKNLAAWGNLSGMRDSAQPTIGWGSNVEVFIRGGYEHPGSGTLPGGYSLTSPISLNMLNLRGFTLRADPNVVIEYTGSGAALTFLQAAGMTLDNINIRLKGETAQQVGIKFRHNARWNHLYQCRVEIGNESNKNNCVGIFFEGDVQNGVGGADISTNTLEQCQVWLQGDHPVDSAFTGNHLAGYRDKANVGIAMLGGDLMANQIKECTVHRMAVGYAQARDANILLTSTPASNACNGLNTYTNSSANYCYVGWHLPGFANTTIVGGRSENNGCYVLQGPAGITGSAVSDEDGVLCLLGVEFAGQRMIGSMTSPAMFVSGTMVDFRTSGSIAAIGSSFLLQTDDHLFDVFRLNTPAPTTDPIKRATLTLSGCRHQCSSPGGYKSSPNSWNNNTNWFSGNTMGWVVNRQWTVSVDGVLR